MCVYCLGTQTHIREQCRDFRGLTKQAVKTRETRLKVFLLEKSRRPGSVPKEMQDPPRTDHPWVKSTLAAISSTSKAVPALVRNLECDGHHPATEHGSSSPPQVPAKSPLSLSLTKGREDFTWGWPLSTTASGTVIAADAVGTTVFRPDPSPPELSPSLRQVPLSSAPLLPAPVARTSHFLHSAPITWVLPPHLATVPFQVQDRPRPLDLPNPRS